MPSGYKTVAPGILKKGDAYFERVLVDGRDTTKKIPVLTLKEAKDYRVRRLAQHAQAREGILLVESPYAKAKRRIASADFNELCQFFLDAGCPDKDRQFKKDKQLAEEIRRVGILRGWPGWKEQVVEQINNATLLRYEAWRRKNSTQMRNGRSIDMEVTTLKNILRCATLHEKLSVYPLANVEVIKLQKGKSQHAKDHCMKSPEELHHFAERLFSVPQSEALGFQALFEAFTGVRTSEALACRWDAKYGEAGYTDGDHIHLARAKDGVNPWAQIHPTLKELLRVMKLWHDTRYPKSPWFFPSYSAPEQAVGVQSLAHALRREVEELIEAGKLAAGSRRTSHGMRAFYVWVRRSEGIADGIIAAEIGDVTGAAIITKHYGPLPPNWRDSKEGKVTWLPGVDKETQKQIPPAWEALLEKRKMPDNVFALQAVA